MIVRPRVDAVFIQVSDMNRAIAWSSTLFALPQAEASHEDLIYDLPLPGETGIVLDGHAYALGEPIQRRLAPLVMFQADDMGDVQAFARTQGIPVTEPEDIGSVTVLYLDDPDGNRFCVKAAKS